MNSTENLDLFNQSIQEQIERIKREQNIQFEVGVMEDLMRMAKLGCFTVYTTVPNSISLEYSHKTNETKATCIVPRMRWTGEEELNRLIAENEILKSKIKELTNNKFNHESGNE